ncbi:MAG: hypothetical protein FH748_01000 [Balneolaceae bacterium]|nr:hypothetical protein [Balneolaceae bacterium]
MKKEYQILLTNVVACLVLYLVFAYLELTFVGYGLALAAASVFLYTLMKAVRSKISSKREYKIMAGVMGYLFAVNLIFGGIQYMNASNQHETLETIRETIDTNIIAIDIHQDLLTTLKTYHEQESGSQKSIVHIFEERVGDRLGSDRVLKSKNAAKMEAYTIYTEMKGDTLVQLFTVTNISKGEKENFDNYNDQVGMIQIEAGLTERGVDYERVN